MGTEWWDVEELDELPVLLELIKVKKTYVIGKRKLEVIRDVSFKMYDGEFIAILGPSGCGKSTLLRIIAGLEKPTSGQILFMNKPIEGISPRIAMVFQSPALLPWLTALENVSLVLEARGMDKKTSMEIARRYLSLVGLAGFENSYPRELSGGMKQRVSIARALAVSPQLLLLDEAFSQLDPLTAESLRSEILDLWRMGVAGIRGIILVTHAVDEAVFMTDRIIVLSSRPTTVVKEVVIDLPRPRNRRSKRFLEILDEVYEYIS